MSVLQFLTWKLLYLRMKLYSGKVSNGSGGTRSASKNCIFLRRRKPLRTPRATAETSPSLDTLLRTAQAFIIYVLRSKMWHRFWHTTEQGVQLIDERPRKGAHNMMVAFIHPRSTGGVLLSLLNLLKKTSMDAEFE